MWNILIGITVPLIGTILGSSVVLFTKDKLNSKIEKLLLGFASGVMIAASIWSLIIPSIDMSENMGKFSIIPAAVGFVLGMLFLLFLDSVLPHLHVHSEEVEGLKTSNLKKKTMMFLAVTLHNIPEGAIVSFDMKNKGESNKKSFLYGVVSGVVEPIGSLIVILFSALLTSVIPYFLSFAAGAMIYVVVEELIPESQNGKHSNIATIGVMLGFTLMMVLDVVLA